MEADEEGFLYPLINQDLCRDCNECLEVCPILKEGHFKEEIKPDFYVAKHKDKDVLKSLLQVVLLLPFLILFWTKAVVFMVLTLIITLR